MRYIARRLLHGFVAAGGRLATLLLFADLAPGDYFSQLRTDPRVSAETVAALRAPVRSRPALAGALRRLGGFRAPGRFGYSLAYNSPVGPLLWARVRATLLLTGTATCWLG